MSDLRTKLSFCALLVLWLGVCLPAPADTLEIQVSSNSDDAHEDSGGDVKLNDSSIELGQMDWAGFRFQNVSIPQGSTITSASVEMRSSDNNTESTDLTLFGNNVDNASSFGGSYDISGRAKTSVSVTWNGVENWSKNQWHYSPSLTAIVQEIVNRPGWSSGNSMAILIRSDDLNGKRLPFSHDDNGNKAAKLHIVYDPNTPSDPNSNGLTILFVRAGSSSYSSEEQLRVDQFESWGYTVVPIDDGDSQTNFDVALAAADVAFVSEEASASSTGYKLRTATIGVVSEEPFLDEEFGFATSDGSESSADEINITDNTHDITSGLSTGLATVFSSSQPSVLLQGTAAGGLQQLATSSGGTFMLGYIEFGGALANSYSGNDTATGRRVRLPWGGGSFSFASLNSTSLTILQNALQWASTPSSQQTNPELYLSTLAGSTFGGLTIEDEDIARFDPNTSTATMFAEGDAIFAADEDTDAFHIQTNGKILLSTTGGATIGGLTFEDEDVVEYDPNTGTATMYFEGDNVFSADEDVDAFCVLSNRDIVLSTTGNAAIGGLSFSDEDLVLYDPDTGTATMLLDGSTLITDDSGNGHDINAVHVDSEGFIYLSMNNNSTIGGLSFGDDDVVKYDPNTGTATLVFEGASQFSATNEDIDALALPVPITGALEAHWQLTELTGSTATDSSAAALDGTYNGGVTLNSSGPYPGDGAIAADFDGGNDEVTLPAMNYDYSNGFSASFWFKPDSAPSVEYAFLGISNGQDVDDIWIGWLPGTGIEIYFSDTVDGAQHRWLDDNVDPGVGKWQHFAVSVDPNGNATMYRDGEAIATGFVSLPAAGSRSQNFIGDSVWIDNFDGSMFDVRVWNREISATEVADLYGLVGHWKMDEGFGITAADSTGYSNDAPLSGATWTSTCGGQYALEFDGAGGTAATSSSFEPPAQGTVAFWFRSDGPPAGRQRPWGLNADFEMWQDTDGLLSCDVSTDGYQGGFMTTTPLYTEGQWYHVVAVYDSADESYSIYLDGELHKSGISTWDIVDQSAGTLTFGTRTGSTQYFAGAMRDFRIYNRPISNQEISDLSGLIAHWQLNETTGSVADDAAVLDQDATYVSAPTLGVNGPYPAATGTAVELDGSSDYITSGRSLLNNLSEFTMMGWVKIDDDVARQSFFGQNDLIEFGIQNTADEIHLWTNSGGSITHSQQLPPGKWVHMAAVGSGTGLTVYINGREAATGGSATSNYGSSTDPFKIGEGVFNGSGDLLDGRVDDVRVYSRAMCPDEINGAYKGGRPSGVRILNWVETR